MVNIKTANEFHDFIQGDLVVIDFSAEWSGPCKMFDMVMEEVEVECSNASFAKVDSDRFRSIAREYNVVSVPVVCIFSNGKVARQQSGFMRKEELLSFINQ